MENKQQSNKDQLAINTGSNFFNSSEDQFNKLVNGESPLSGDSVFEQVDTGSQIEKKQNQIQMNEEICGNEPEAANNRAKYGNHRNKTTRGFQRANLKRAIKQCMNQGNRQYRGKSVKLFPPEQHFKNFSPGIYLFFSFLKRASLLFFILSLLSLFPIVYNYLNGTYYQFSASTLQVEVAKMMLGNQSLDPTNAGETLKDKIFIMLSDGIIILCFLCFYIFWESFSKNVQEEFKKGWKRMSQFTIQVTEFGKQVGEKQMEEFFKRFGDIQEIAAVKNYQEMIDISKQIYELSLQIKQESIIQQNKIATKQQTQLSKSHIKKIQKKQTQLSTLMESLEQIEEKREKKNIKYYITFEEVKSVNNVMETYEPYNKLFCVGKVPQQLLIQGILPKIKKCAIQPAEIIWENIHITRKSRWLRFLIQAIIVLVVICIGFVIITLINISTPPTSYHNIGVDSLTFAQVQSKSIYSISYTWCLNKNSASSLSAEQTDYCSKYISDSKLRLFLTVSISFVIIIIKSLLKMLMIKIAHFQRYKNHTELSTNVMTNLFVIYISTTVMITFLMQANIFGVSAKNIVKGLITNEGLLDNLGQIKEYNDLVQDWYKDIGYQIWLNWLILSIFPHPLTPLFLYIKKKINLYRSKSKTLQKHILQLLQPQQFQIQDNYANILMLIFVGLLFSAGIPFLIMLTFLGLLTRYFVFKATFVKFCRIPKYYTSSINERVQLLMQVTIVLHICMAIWMFGVTQIFGTGDRIQDFGVGADGEKNGWLLILDKITAHWYLTLLLCSVLAFLLFNRIVIQTLLKLCKRSQKQSQVHPQAQVSKKKLKKTQVTLTQSYKIQNNPNYFEILAIMKPQQIKSTIKMPSNINNMISFAGVSYAGMLANTCVK